MIKRPDNDAIQARITEIEADERWKSSQKHPARVDINAPLALIQVSLEAERCALRWVLSMKGK